MFMTHRAWRHAYAAAYCHYTRDQADTAARSRDPKPRDEKPPDEKQRHSVFTWSSGPMFGVRRPLRHLAHKLQLSDPQLRTLVEILDRLKTGYGQSKLDQDRSLSEVAAVFAGATFNSERASAALDSRIRSTQTLNQELLAAMQQIYELLSEAQRHEFAYLLRSGVFAL